MKKSILSDVVIMAIGKMATMSIQFITTIFLARILLPEDFGIVAMCTIFMNVSNVLIDSGMGGSIIYYKDTTEKDYHTIFWFNFIISLLLYLLLYSFSNCISSFYGSQILEPIIKICGLSIIAHSCCIIQSTLLSKKKQFVIQVKIFIYSSLLTSCIVIILAIYDFGIWALAAQTLLLNVVQTIFYIVYGHYWPKLYFSISLLKKHWNFGSKLLFVSLLKLLYDNMYVQLIGKVVTFKDAGFYNQAKRVNDVPMNIIQMPLERVIFPTLVHVDRFEDKILEMLKCFSLVLIPFLILCSLIAPFLIIILFGEKWSESGWMLRLMFIGTIGASLENLNRSFIKATGKIKFLVKYDIWKRILNMIIVVLSLAFGVEGILYAFIVNGFTGWLINCFVLYKINGCSLALQIKSVFSILAVSLIAYFFALFADKYVSSCNVPLNVIVQIGTYICIIVILFNIFLRKNVGNLLNLIKQYIY